MNRRRRVSVASLATLFRQQLLFVGMVQNCKNIIYFFSCLGQVEGGQFFVGDVSKFPFAALILDLQNLIAAEFLDGATRCSLALSCQSFYRRFYDKELYGLGFPLECIRAGHDDLLAFALDELGCPLLPSPYLSRFSLDAELKFHNQTFAILERISMDSFFGKKDETETLDFYEVFASLVARSTDADYNRIIEGKLWKRFSDMPFLSKKSLLLKLAGKGCLRFLKLVSKFADAGEDLSRVPTVPVTLPPCFSFSTVSLVFSSFS